MKDYTGVGNSAIKMAGITDCVLLARQIIRAAARRSRSAECNVGHLNVRGEEEQRRRRSRRMRRGVKLDAHEKSLNLTAAI